MADRRHKPRFSTYGLSTAFGQVTNLSDTGLCIFRKGRMDVCIGDEFEMNIQHPQLTKPMRVKVARIERLGLFRHEIGLEFVAMDPLTLATLQAITQDTHDELIGPRCTIAA